MGSMQVFARKRWCLEYFGIVDCIAISGCLEMVYVMFVVQKMTRVSNVLFRQRDSCVCLFDKSESCIDGRWRWNSIEINLLDLLYRID